MVAPRSTHSASASGSAEPMTSSPTWWNWRSRPFWGRSARNIGSKVQSLTGEGLEPSPCWR
jgi:hypothetical protein